MSRIELVALPSPRHVTAGDDLTALVVAACEDAGVDLRDGDVLCVASKVVSKVEGRTVALPDDAGDPDEARRDLARRHARRIVAETPAVLVTETSHGFVCANGGVDLSNTPDGQAVLLPADPDASAAQLRTTLATRADVGVVVTDTFGRAWRMGQTDVALGVAGTAALRDERGDTDMHGQPLTVTLVAVADEIAAAADLLRRKDDGIPFVLVRGLPAEEPDGTGADLVRPPDEDVFRHGGPEAVEAGIAARRTIRRFADAPIPGEVLARAVAAAATAPSPHGTTPWRFLRLTDATRTSLLDAMTERWRDDLRRDGVAEEVIEDRIHHSDAILRHAPELLVPTVTLDGADDYPDLRRATAERDMFLLAGGAALQNLQVVLAAHGIGAAWISSTLFCAPTVRSVLGLDDHVEPLGMIAAGRPVTPPPSRSPRDPQEFLCEL